MKSPHPLPHLLIFSLFFFTLRSQTLGSVSDLGTDQAKQESKPFVMKGWLKFFTYTPSFYASSVPNKFEYNPAYLAQFSYGRTPTFTDKDKDQWGFLNVPDDTHFFMILTKKTLFAVNARRNDIARTYKSIELNWIEPIITGDQAQGYKGGMEDIGNFREGFCWKLKSTTNVIWNICADTLDQKEKWMSEIAKTLNTAGSNYKSSGESMVLSQEVKIPFEITAGTPPIPEQGPPPLVAKPGARVDGRWVILQDWSQCTQACGGGKQYLQRMCVPPQNGGNPCEGEALLTKDCNTGPCPNVINSVTEAPANPTTIKMQKLSSRPLRYEICVVREGDLDLGIEGQGFAMMPRFPVRVILNNKTLSIFTLPSFDNVYRSYDLNYLNVKQSAEEPKACLVVSDQRDASKKATLCIMPTAVREGFSVEKEKESWVHDIFFFRDKCKDRNKFVEESPEIKKKRMEVEVEAKEEKYERIRNKENEDQQKVIEAKVQETATTAMEAVEKETKFEQLAFEEELMREREEENALNKQLLSEEDKKKCMEREVLKRQQMADLQQQTLEMSERSESIKKSAAMQIQASRLEFKRKMDKMKRQAERRRREAKQKLSEVRTTMAQIVLDDNKIGNITTCLNHKFGTEGERNQACMKLTGVPNDPEKLKDCNVSNEDYCYVCCETEFGKNKQEFRNRCFKVCDNPEEAMAQAANDKGFWAYVPQAAATPR